MCNVFLRRAPAANITMTVILLLMIDGAKALERQDGCAAEIARIEAALDSLAGTTAHQSIDAQLHRQPTSKSIAEGRKKAVADREHDRGALGRAHEALARGDQSACFDAISELRHDVRRR